LDSPYATIAYALSQVTVTRNIIYILNKGEDYTESGLTVSGNVIIRGENNAVTIDAQNAGRIFTVTGTLSLEDITLTGGMVEDNGGAVFVNGGNLTVSNAIFRENKATNGGAIYVAGTANIESNQFTSNNATYGGAIYVNSASDVSISSNTFEGNTADEGEAIYIENGAVSLSENTISDGQTIYLGGGTVNSILIFLANSTVNADFGETVTLTATLTDDQGNPIEGGNVVFTANGETVATVPNNGGTIETSYVVPSDATADILISGSFSPDNGGVVATGVVHPAISYWFIEGGSGY
jgi:predicted outer membrane repeat protein